MSPRDGNAYLWAHGACFAGLAGWALLILVICTGGHFPPVLFAVASLLGLAGSIAGLQLGYAKTPFVLYLLVFLASLLPWLYATH